MGGDRLPCPLDAAPLLALLLIATSITVLEMVGGAAEVQLSVVGGGVRIGLCFRAFLPKGDVDCVFAIKSGFWWPGGEKYSGPFLQLYFYENRNIK